MALDPNALAQPAAPDPHGMQPLEIVNMESAPVVAPEAPADAEKPPIFDPRKEAMDAILANRKAQIETEIAYVDPPVTNPPAEPIVEEPAAAAAPAAAQPETPPAAPAADPAVQKHKLKVNGVDLEFTQDELLRAASKGLGAEQKLEEATRLRREAEALTRQTPSAPDPRAQAPQPETPATPMDADHLKKLARAISYGSEDESASAIRELVQLRAGDGRANGPTPDQIVQAATQNALAHIQRESALTTFGQEYSDVLKDPNLTYLAAQYVHVLRDNYAKMGVPRSELDLYREAGKTVTDWDLSRKAPPPGTQTPSASSVSTDRVERKRAAPKPPIAAASIRAPLAPEAPQIPRGSAIVNQMRKARGQAVFS